MAKGWSVWHGGRGTPGDLRPARSAIAGPRRGASVELPVCWRHTGRRTSRIDPRPFGGPSGQPVSRRRAAPDCNHQPLAVWRLRVTAATMLSTHGATMFAHRRVAGWSPVVGRAGRLLPDGVVSRPHATRRDELNIRRITVGAGVAIAVSILGAAPA